MFTITIEATDPMHDFQTGYVIESLLLTVDIHISCQTLTDDRNFMDYIVQVADWAELKIEVTKHELVLTGTEEALREFLYEVNDELNDELNKTFDVANYDPNWRHLDIWDFSLGTDKKYYHFVATGSKDDWIKANLKKLRPIDPEELKRKEVRRDEEPTNIAVVD
jgi:hypothetical protein